MHDQALPVTLRRTTLPGQGAEPTYGLALLDPKRHQPARGPDGHIILRLEERSRCSRRASSVWTGSERRPSASAHAAPRRTSAPAIASTPARTNPSNPHESPSGRTTSAAMAAAIHSPPTTSIMWPALLGVLRTHAPATHPTVPTPIETLSITRVAAAWEKPRTVPARIPARPPRITRPSEIVRLGVHLTGVLSTSCLPRLICSRADGRTTQRTREPRVTEKREQATNTQRCRPHRCTPSCLRRLRRVPDRHGSDGKRRIGAL